MSANEVQNLLKLDLVEVPVYGQVPVDSILPQPAKKALRPSKPGPVSQSGYTVREAEGPKHLYILRMGGPIHALLGEDPEEALIVKVGFSRSPETRCDTHNKALPAGTFRWTVWKTTFEPERDPLPSSQHAIAGEDAMKTYLDAKGKSLGGEFFLASPKAIKKAWKIGVETAENWKP
ncbi:hypothetical protein [Novosphingobium sp. MBES04]|uniref:hypothetical protein n=1 Tax=Novosphingobium sp. MBES04 TaxID=1206458 RepID=UPI00057E4BA3|nr:hypothetical protein [Novosphingobium sp. MBES04]